VDRALAKAEKAVREEAFAPPPRDAGAEATGILRFRPVSPPTSEEKRAAEATPSADEKTQEPESQEALAKGLREVGSVLDELEKGDEKAGGAEGSRATPAVVVADAQPPEGGAGAGGPDDSDRGENAMDSASASAASADGDREPRRLKMEGSIPLTGDREKDVTTWVEVVTGSSRGDLSFHDWLMDGTVLCSLANKIQPGIIEKVHPSTAMMFKKMENITNFIRASRTLGVLEKDVFNTVDLYEAKNLASVQTCIFNLGAASRTAPSFSGPYLGVAQVGIRAKDTKRESRLVSFRPGGETTG